jgi:hypothetical protein
MQMPIMSPNPFVRAMAIEAVSGNERTSSAEMPRIINDLDLNGEHSCSFVCIRG